MESDTVILFREMDGCDDALYPQLLLRNDIVAPLRRTPHVTCLGLKGLVGHAELGSRLPSSNGIRVPPHGS
jgi:hypothetical protein